MKNTQYEIRRGRHLPKQVQMDRIRHAVSEELTSFQRETLLAYYIHGKNIPQIAAERGVNKTTVWRTLRRAENRLRHYLRY
jgi:DNA-directed RNA polymerase specialized sigma24 family protein